MDRPALPAIMQQPTSRAAAFETKTDQTYTASDTDQSGVFVTDGGTLTLSQLDDNQQRQYFFSG